MATEHALNAVRSLRRGEDIRLRDIIECGRDWREIDWITIRYACRAAVA